MRPLARAVAKARRAWVVVLLGAFVAVVVAATWPARPAKPSHGGADEVTAATRGDEPAAAVAAEATRKGASAHGGAVAASPPLRDEDAEDDVRAKQRAARVSHAIELLRFPPHSQPLGPDMADVLQPNRRHESPMPLAGAAIRGAPGAAPPSKEDALAYLLTGDAYTLVGRRALVATLEVFREGSRERERVAVDITRASVSLVSGGVPSGPAAPLVDSPVVMNDEGHGGDAVAGDHLYGVTIDPSAAPALAGRRGLARLEVEFAAREGDRRPARAALDFRLAPAVPGVIVGVAGERLTPEGLEIAVDVRADDPGTYFVQGLLFDSTDRPIGFAVARPVLARGRATVPLLFFGLLFHEARAAAGPYVFRTVTAHRLPRDDEAERADMETWTGPYRTTKAYSLADFSDKEYESAAKDAKIQALAALAARKGGPR